MKLTLQIWRQRSPDSTGRLVSYTPEDVTAEMSFLEMLDVLNDSLERTGKEPVAFDHDCREGICGACSLVINGVAHGPGSLSTVCQLYMRSFQDGDAIVIEPWRAAAFPVVKDLVVDRSAFDRIVQVGGYVSINTGSAPDGNALLVGKKSADAAFDAAACIGCGACVAACPNASAMLFTSAKITQLARLPQGQPERLDRARAMVAKMDEEGFGTCRNYSECEAVCPKGISLEHIAKMNRDVIKAAVGEP